MTRPVQGLRAWMIQRVSAIYLALFTLVMLLRLLWSPPGDHLLWRAWLASPWVFVGFTLFILLLLAHAWVGLRDVIMDYIQSLRWRSVSLAVVAGALLGLGIWAARLLIVVATP